MIEIVQLLRHTDADAGTLGYTSRGYAHGCDMDGKFDSSVERTNHGDSQLDQQRSAASNNSSGTTNPIARGTAY